MRQLTSIDGTPLERRAFSIIRATRYKKEQTELNLNVKNIDCVQERQ